MKLIKIWEWVLFALVILLMLADIAITVSYSEYAICNPKNRVNVRFSPSKHGSVCAYLECGDEITLDGRKKGEWVHVVGISGESDEGWVHQGYITEGPVIVETYEAYAYKDKVRVRDKVGGTLKCSLHKGEKVTVYATSISQNGWAVTNRGYIMAGLLDDGLGGI